MNSSVLTTTLALSKRDYHVGLMLELPSVLMMMMELPTALMMMTDPLPSIEDYCFVDIIPICQILPLGFGIVCTHPMFGPESGKNGWGKLPFVYDKVRVAEHGDQAIKCEQFLSIFEHEVILLNHYRLLMAMFLS
jgi:hypothetical protein